MNRPESTVCLSFINYNNNDDWIKQLALTVGKPPIICKTSDRHYIYSLCVRYIRTIYVYVVFKVFTFRQKKIHIYPENTLNITSLKVWSDGQMAFHGRSNV